MKKYFLLFCFLAISLFVVSQNYVIRLAEDDNGNVLRSKLQTAKGITIEGKDNPRIIKFRMSAMVFGLEKNEFSNSSKFTRKQLKMIRNNYSLKRIEIDKIKVKTGSKVISLPRKVFIVADYFRNQKLDLCVFAGKESQNSLSYQEILKNPHIKLINSNFGEIIEFTFSYCYGMDYSCRMTGNTFSKEQLRRIDNLSSGARFMLENIKIRKKDGEIIRANPLIYNKK